MAPRPSKSESTSLSALSQALKRREFSPVYFFYGEEDFLLEEGVASIVDGALKESEKSFNLDIVYGSEVDVKHLVALASAFPMLAERRVVVVREFDKLSNKEPLVSYVSHPSPTTSLVILSSKPDFRLKIYKIMKESAVLVESKPLYESEIPQWIEQRVHQRGKEISPRACQLVQNYVGRSLREIHNEIEKLFIFVGDRKTIDDNDVNEVVGMSRQYNFFELQNAFGMKDISRALEISEHMLGAGEQPVGMVAMLARYLQKLWIIREALSRQTPKQDIASMLNISPKAMYFLDADLQKARKFSLKELEEGFLLLRDADVRLKTSNGDAKLVITLLLYHLIKGASAGVAA